MQYGEIENVGKPISRLGFGTIMFNAENQDESFALMDAMLELGANMFDSANNYGRGDSERVAGRWMSERGTRDKMVVLTKGAHQNRDRKRVTPYDITSDLMDSLARLKTDYIDLYVLHRDNPEVEVGVVVDVLNEHFQAGRIRAFGGSNWSAQRIKSANEYAAKQGLEPMRLSSPHFSLAQQYQPPWPNCVAISGPEGEADRQWYAEAGFPVFSWSSLARGFFSGRMTRENFEEVKGEFEPHTITSYCGEENFQRLDRAYELAAEKELSVAQIAMAFVMNSPMNVFALVGAQSGEEMRQNIVASQLELAPEELDWLDLRRDSR